MIEIKVNKLLNEYLDSMQTLPPPDINLMRALTLKDLRERVRTADGKKVTKIRLGQMLKRSRTTIADWEEGRHLDGITTSHILIMATNFGCRVEEVVAVIENTRMLTEEDNNQNTPPLEVVQR